MATRRRIKQMQIVSVAVLRDGIGKGSDVIGQNSVQRESKATHTMYRRATHGHCREARSEDLKRHFAPPSEFNRGGTKHQQGRRIEQCESKQDKT